MGEDSRGEALVDSGLKGRVLSSIGHTEREARSWKERLVPSS